MSAPRPIRAATALALTLAVGPLAAAQAPRPAPYGDADPLAPAAVRAPRREDPLVEARRRFEALDPATRRRLRERYERFRALSPEARSELAERLRRLEETRRRAYRLLPPELRERLEALPAEQRESVLRDLVEAHLAEKGQRLSRKVPESFRERLARARPQDRLRFFAEFKEKTRSRLARTAVRYLGRALQLSPEDLARLEALPPELQVRRALELRRRLGLRQAEQRGLPAGLTPEAWERIAQLPPEEFYAAFQALRAQARAAARARRGAGGGDAAAEDTSGPRTPQPDPPAPDPSDGATRTAIAEELRAAAHIDPASWIEHAELSRPERRRLVYGEAAERILELVERRRLLPPRQIERWRSRPPAAVVRWAADFADDIEAGKAPLHPGGADERTGGERGAEPKGPGKAAGAPKSGGKAQPNAKKPGAKAGPGGKKSGAKGKPGAKKPGAKQPGGKKPGGKNPGAKGKSGAKKPGAKQPGGKKPGGKNPGAKSKPGAKKPGAKQPGGKKPGTKGKPRPQGGGRAVR